MWDLQKSLITALKKSGVKLTRRRSRTAEEIREFYLEIYRQNTRLPRCFTQSHDAECNLKAYQMMTGREILASEKRDYELRGKQLTQFLTDYKKFEEESRKTRIVVRTRIA